MDPCPSSAKYTVSMKQTTVYTVQIICFHVQYTAKVIGSNQCSAINVMKIILNYITLKGRKNLPLNTPTQLYIIYIATMCFPYTGIFCCLTMYFSQVKLTTVSCQNVTGKTEKSLIFQCNRIACHWLKFTHWLQSSCLLKYSNMYWNSAFTCTLYIAKLGANVLHGMLICQIC